MSEELAAPAAPVSCGFCGVVGAVMHRDHIIPRSRGGADEARNCIVACVDCNLSKSDRTPSEWRPTGLATWIYEVEEWLAKRYRMKSRDRSRSLKVRTLTVPGYALLHNKTAICLEFDARLCGRTAEWATWDPLSGTWGAKCFRCAQYYASDWRTELDELRGVAHVLVQLRAGTLPQKDETVLGALARVGGASLDELLDLAHRVLTGEDAVRAPLIESFPALRLEMWIPK